MAEHQLTFRNSASGLLLTVFDAFVSLDMARSENNIGALTLVLPSLYDNFIFAGDDVALDNRIEVNRSINGSSFYLEGETQWLVRHAQKILTADGQRLTKVYAVDAIELLTRRIVAYAAGSAQADKSATAADNLVKAFVRENLGSLATDTARDLSTYLTVQANLTLAPTIAKACSRRNVLEVLQEIAMASAIAGTYLAFDIIAVTSSSLEFRTYIGQRGIDHRASSGAAVFIGPDFGNMSDVVRGYDHLDEWTYVYAGGQGEGEARSIATASDTVRIALSPFNRIEKFIDSRQTSDVITGALQDEADQALRDGRSRKTFTGQFIDTPACLYGLNVSYGDYVTAQFDNESINCRMSKVNIKIEDGKETINIRLISDTVS